MKYHDLKREDHRSHHGAVFAGLHSTWIVERDSSLLSCTIIWTDIKDHKFFFSITPLTLKFVGIFILFSKKKLCKL
jgi:hypothetical protein